MSPQAYIGEDGSGDALTLGDEIITRKDGTMAGSTAVPAANQNLILAYFNAHRQIVSTQARVITGGTAAGATPTLCRLGLYQITTILGILTGTLVASTANDTTLFAASSTAYTKSWSTSVVMQPGARYALGILAVTGAAAPTFVGQICNAVAEAALPPRVTGALAGQADLPATFTDSSLTSFGFRHYGVILP